MFITMPAYTDTKALLSKYRKACKGHSGRGIGWEYTNTNTHRVKVYKNHCLYTNTGARVKVQRYRVNLTTHSLCFIQTVCQ